jgi:hypothetical protein
MNKAFSISLDRNACDNDVELHLHVEEVTIVFFLLNHTFGKPGYVSIFTQK